jgi:hypothetical protein
MRTASMPAHMPAAPSNTTVNQIQTHDEEPPDHDECLCQGCNEALHQDLTIAQIQSGHVNCNVCGMVHPFCACPLPSGMDANQQREHFCGEAAEKWSSKRDQHMNQIHLDDDCLTKDECCGGCDEDDHDPKLWHGQMTDLDWLDFQSGAHNPNSDFW